jgi:hypothetical protein
MWRVSGAKPNYKVTKDGRAWRHWVVVVLAIEFCSLSQTGQGPAGQTLHRNPSCRKAVCMLPRWWRSEAASDIQCIVLCSVRFKCMHPTRNLHLEVASFRRRNRFGTWPVYYYRLGAVKCCVFHTAFVCIVLLVSHSTRTGIYSVLRTKGDSVAGVWLLIGASWVQIKTRRPAVVCVSLWGGSWLFTIIPVGCWDSILNSSLKLFHILLNILLAKEALFSLRCWRRH